MTVCRRNECDADDVGDTRNQDMANYFPLKQSYGQTQKGAYFLSAVHLTIENIAFFFI